MISRPLILMSRYSASVRVEQKERITQSNYSTYSVAPFPATPEHKLVAYGSLRADGKRILGRSRAGRRARAYLNQSLIRNSDEIIF